MFKKLAKYIFSKTFTKNRKGSAAIELALVLPVLITIILGIVEVGFMYHVYLMEQNVAQESLRHAITGNAYLDLNPKQLPRDQFIREAAITKMGNWIKYSNQLVVDTAIINSASDVKGKGSNTVNFGNNGAGIGGNFVIYRLTYNWRFLSPVLKKLMADSQGNFKLTAIVAAKNEDF